MSDLSPVGAEVSRIALDRLLDSAAHFQRRMLQELLSEATSAYWLKRADQFAAVGNERCDAVAEACRNRAAVERMEQEELDFSLGEVRGLDSSRSVTDQLEHCDSRPITMSRAPRSGPPQAMCSTCGTPISPWTCSCGQTRVGGAQ